MIENVSDLNLPTLYSTFTTDFSFHPPYQRVSQTIAFLDKSKTSKQDKHVKFSTTASFLEAQLMDKYNPLDSLKTEESTRAVYVNGTAPALVYTKPCTYIPHLRAVITMYFPPTVKPFNWNNGG